MALPDSRRLAVLKALRARFATMTVAGGYHWDVADSSVSIDPEVNLLTFPAANLPLIVIEPQPGGLRQFLPGLQLVSEFLVSVVMRAEADVSDPLSRATVWEAMAADIEKAITVDVTLGGLVYDLRLPTEPEPFVQVGARTVLLVQQVAIRLHRTYGDGT